MRDIHKNETNLINQMTTIKRPESEVPEIKTNDALRETAPV